MQIVIDIPEELYDLVQDKLDFNGTLDPARVRTLMRAVDNGKPLPKQHGPLIDADRFFGKYCEIAIAPYLYETPVIEAERSK